MSQQTCQKCGSEFQHRINHTSAYDYAVLIFECDCSYYQAFTERKPKPTQEEVEEYLASDDYYGQPDEESGVSAEEIEAEKYKNADPYEGFERNKF